MVVFCSKTDQILISCVKLLVEIFKRTKKYKRNSISYNILLPSRVRVFLRTNYKINIILDFFFFSTHYTTITYPPFPHSYIVYFIIIISFFFEYSVLLLLLLLLGQELNECTFFLYITLIPSSSFRFFKAKTK